MLVVSLAVLGGSIELRQDRMASVQDYDTAFEQGARPGAESGRAEGGGR